MSHSGPRAPVSKSRSRWRRCERLGNHSPNWSNRPWPSPCSQRDLRSAERRGLRAGPLHSANSAAASMTAETRPTARTRRVCRTCGHRHQSPEPSATGTSRRPDRVPFMRTVSIATVSGATRPPHARSNRRVLDGILGHNAWRDVARRPFDEALHSARSGGRGLTDLPASGHLNSARQGCSPPSASALPPSTYP